MPVIFGYGNESSIMATLSASSPTPMLAQSIKKPRTILRMKKDLAENNLLKKSTIGK